MTCFNLGPHGSLKVRAEEVLVNLDVGLLEVDDFLEMFLEDLVRLFFL